MQIAIIGAGNVGGALGAGWGKAGHTITYGVPAPDNPKHQPVAKAAGDAVITSVPAAISGADVIVLATPWDAVPAALAACGEPFWPRANRRHEPAANRRGWVGACDWL